MDPPKWSRAPSRALGCLNIREEKNMENTKAEKEKSLPEALGADVTPQGNFRIRLDRFLSLKTIHTGFKCINHIPSSSLDSLLIPAAPVQPADRSPGGVPGKQGREEKATKCAVPSCLLG